MKIDLHVHTNHSDGTWSVEEMIEYAVTADLTHLALTDHDTVSGVEPAIAAARGRVELIPGVEINTVQRDWNAQVQDVHILGYFVDPYSIELKLALNAQLSLRNEHVAKVISKLNDAHIPLTMDDIKQHSGTGSIGKAHITKALVSIGAARDIMEAYEKYTSKTSPFFIQRESISPVEAVKAIKTSGGIASLAHSGKRSDVFDLLKSLMDAGLEAVEVHHRMHSAEERKNLEDFATANDLLTTGGSDCHGPYEDFLPTIGSITCPAEAFEKLKQRKNFQSSVFSSS